MASLITTDSSAKDEILDDIFNIPTDNIDVEISPVEGYSEIKMLSSPFGGAMLSPNNDNFSYINTDHDSSRTITATEGSTSTTAASSDNDDIPQWKKDLIQRRKSNIVRTIGANQSVTCPKKGFLDALESIKQADDNKKSTTSSPVLPPLIIKSNSNNTSSNSIKSTLLDDDSSNSSEYLQINLNADGGIGNDNVKRYQHNYNNDELNISSNNNKQPANNNLKNTIKVQHKQQYNNYEYNNKDINDENDDDDCNDDIDNCIETGISGGQYTIKNINISGNTIIKSPLKQQQQQEETSQINKNINFSTPTPKLRNSLNNTSPTGNNSTTTTTEKLSNNSSLNSDTTSIIINNSDSSSCEQQLNLSSKSLSSSSSSILTSSALSKTSSNQLHSKHDTVNTLNTVTASTSSNDTIKTVGLGNNNNNLINKKCDIGKINTPITLNQNQIIKNTNNNNKYIKNTQNSSNNINQKIKIKKMVAAQDINDSSGTGTPNQTQTQHSTILDDNNSTLLQYNDFDSSEELQYGPGIVSKLRVRYLSLALRQTNCTKRTNLDNLRRATSLNNLLDGGGSTGSTNDDSIIDGDIIDNELNGHNQLINHQQQQEILNHITTTQQNNHQQLQQNKIHKNVSWLNEKDQQQQNSNNLINNYIKEQEYLNTNNVDDDDIENSKEFDDIETTKNGGKFLYEKNYNKKPENFYNNKTGIMNNNNYQQNKELIQQQQKQRNGRQVKRGNDSLKRARSVEALLCEKSSWLNNNNKNLNCIGDDKMSISSGGSEMLLVTEKPESNEINLIGIDNNQKNLLKLQHQKLKTNISIDDKIINARERLHNTTEKQSPPKRITSLIDDTERPPPDLVKQTLKLFEATANRRNGRSLSRNTNNQVAVKIANYKSIISQEKPLISYPKPPLSPKRNINNNNTNIVINKKPNTLDLKSNNKINNIIGKNSNSPINSPVLDLTKKFSGIEINDIENKYKSSTITTTNNHQLSSPTAAAASVIASSPPQILPRNNLTRNINDNPISPQQQRTPDLIPRKHFDNLNHQISTDSPITQLTKKINHLNLEDLPVTTINTSSSSPITTTDGINKNPFTICKSIDELINDTEDSITTDDELDESNDDGDIMIKHISKKALENISKAGSTQHFSFSKMNNLINNEQQQINNLTSNKQIGIIRPLVTELKKDNNLSLIVGNSSNNINNGGASNNIDNIKPQRDNLVISNLNQTKHQLNNNTTSKTKFIDNNIITGKDKPALTTREIEKNLINEKKNELANLETNNDGGINNASASLTSTPTPIWQLNKKIKIGSNNGQPIETQNNIMVFNFQDRKDVPDYIENDGLLIKRRRELPKPNESGFVLLGDLTLETSTDPDESWTMGPPSPCNVEFENANIIIDGKSNLRYRSKESSLRVQFDDTLTSTFEYPSESSFIDDNIEPQQIIESFNNTIDSLEHIDADEIIQIPNNIIQQSPISISTIATGQKSLGNMSLGSAPLGSYTPIKAQIQTNFELGITRVPNNSNQMNGGNSLNDNQQLNGTSKDIVNNSGVVGNGENKSVNNKQIITDTGNSNNDDINGIEKNTEPESLQYLKPATDDLTVVYSEGTQKTDLLY